MKKYTAKSFNIPHIEGISEKTIDVHLKLYAGYITNLNKQYEEMMNCKDMAATTAVLRRVSFELAGVENHNTYFSALEGGPKPMPDSELYTKIKAQFGSIEGLIKGIRTTAVEMRGIGWVIAVYDKKEDFIHILWVSDHELGNVNLPAIIALDMWEHSYMIDYLPADKAKYVDAYLGAINWEVISDKFKEI